MAVYSKNTFIGQRIKLDGHTFSGNKFQNCILVYGGGPLNFDNNALIGARWEFVDNAERTVGLLASFYQDEGSSKEFVELLLSTHGKKIEDPEPQPEPTTPVEKSEDE